MKESDARNDRWILQVTGTIFGKGRMFLALGMFIACLTGLSACSSSVPVKEDQPLKTDKQKALSATDLDAAPTKGKIDDETATLIEETQDITLPGAKKGTAPNTSGNASEAGANAIEVPADLAGDKALPPIAAKNQAESDPIEDSPLDFVQLEKERQLGQLTEYDGVAAARIKELRAKLEYLWAKEKQDNPGSEVYQEMAVIFANLGNYQRAIEAMEKAVTAAPDNLGLRFNLASLYMMQGDERKAEQLYKDVLADHPDNPDAMNHYGLILLSLGQSDDALKLFRRVIEKDYKNFDAHLNIALLYHKIKKDSMAYTLLTNLKSNSPQVNSAYYVVLGNVYESMNNTPKAIESYEQAVQADPNAAEAYNNLGAIYLDAMKLDKASEALMAAVKINPAYYDAFNNLAIIFREKNKCDQAQQEYQRAQEINPNKPEIYANLGMLYQDCLHDRNSALDYYKKYANLMGSRLAKDDPVRRWMKRIQDQIRREQEEKSLSGEAPAPATNEAGNTGAPASPEPNANESETPKAE